MSQTMDHNVEDQGDSFQIPISEAIVTRGPTQGLVEGLSDGMFP